MTFRPPYFSKQQAQPPFIPGQAGANVVLLGIPAQQVPPFLMRDWPVPIGLPFPVSLRTWTLNHTFFRGQDTFFGAPGEVIDYTWPNPLGHIRSLQGPDRSFTLPPSRPLVLRGLDTFFGAPGQPPVRDMRLPIRLLPPAPPPVTATPWWLELLGSTTSNTVALVARSLSSLTGVLSFTGSTPLAGAGRTLSVGKAGMAPRTALLAQGTTTSSGRASVLFMAQMASKALVTVRASAGFSGAAFVAAKATVESFGRAAISAGTNLQAMLGATKSQLTARGTITGAATLSARATAAMFGRLAQPGAIQLLASAFIRSIARLSAPTVTTSLQGRSILTLSSTAGGSFTQKLLGSTRVQLTSLAKATSTAGMSATSAVKVFGRLVPPTGKTALAGATRAATAIRGGLLAVSPLVSLQAQTLIKSMISGLLTAFGLSPRVATTAIQVRSVDAPYEIRSVDAPAEVRSVDAPSLT